jgi:hypothetical protein
MPIMTLKHLLDTQYHCRTLSFAHQRVWNVDQEDIDGQWTSVVEMESH